MTATMIKKKQATGQWSSIFPTEQITEQQSALFVKKLLAVAVSNITYLRAIFPEHAFGDRCIEDLNLKILKDDSSCPGSCQVIKWVKGCFDALEKKYLRMVIIGIYVDEDKPDTVIESYTFKFSYRDKCGVDIYRNEKKISSAYNADETKKATVRLLRTVIVLTQTLKSLPDDVMMTMKLLYYDDVTPADYEPPGFKSSPTDSFIFAEEPANISIGDVNTPFHSVKVRIKTAKSQFEMEEVDGTEEVKDSKEVIDEFHIQVSQENDKEVEVQDKEHGYGLSEAEAIYVNAGDVPVESPSIPSTNDKAVTSNNDDNDDISDDYTVKCACGCNEDDGLMILCDICKLWQHGVCFLVLSEQDAPVNHICNECAQVNDYKDRATDPCLNGMSAISVQALCLWRRALQACVETKAILAHTFARRLGVEVTVAQGLINRLTIEGYVRATKGKKHGKLINADRVRNHGFLKYLKRNTDKKSDCHVEQPQDNNIELENLAKKAKDMEIRRKTPMRTDKIKDQNTEKSNHKAKVVGKDDVAIAPARRGRKRAISKVDESCEFDVSNSQDIDGEGDRSRAKKKSSISSHAIMV